MKWQPIALSAVAILLLPATSAHSQRGPQSVSFNASSISGFPSGSAFLTGGGTYDLATGFVKVSGHFRCLTDINQGPLTNCKAGEGVRWDSAQILESTTFKCTGAASEQLKTATTDDNTVVIQADFYRQGDGVNESFTGKIIISALDLDPVLPGIQNVWIEKVGCGDGNTHFQ
jgi:hypothetical protein